MHQISKIQNLKIRHYRKPSAYWILSTALCLSGCMGVYEGGFECPPGEGVGCKSISEVNDFINKGSLPNSDLGNIPISECEDCTSRGNHSPQDIPMSQEEPTLWIAPWALTETP